MGTETNTESFDEAGHFPPTADPAEVCAHLNQFGFAIVDDLVDDALLDQLAAEAQPYIEGSATGRDSYDGRFTRRTGSLIARCPAARPLVMDPLVVGTIERSSTRRRRFSSI